MAAPRTQKTAPANAGKTTAKRRSTSRASSSRTLAQPPALLPRASARPLLLRRARASRSPHGPPGPRARHPTTRASRPRAAQVRSRITTLILIVAIVAAAWWVYPIFRLQYEHQREVETLEGELEGLKSRNDELREDVEELKTPEGVEQLARESLGLVKPGEQAYVVTGGVAIETTATVSPEDGEAGVLGSGRSTRCSASTDGRRRRCGVAARPRRRAVRGAPARVARSAIRPRSSPLRSPSSGEPFPTLYYLTCPHLVAAVGRLESDGLMEVLRAQACVGRVAHRAPARCR